MNGVEYTVQIVSVKPAKANIHRKGPPMGSCALPDIDAAYSRVQLSVPRRIPAQLVALDNRCVRGVS